VSQRHVRKERFGWMTGAARRRSNRAAPRARLLRRCLDQGESRAIAGLSS
jgi:hypothetical protein